MKSAVQLPAAGLTLGALTPPGASRVASFFIAPERGQYAFAIFAARSFVRSKGIGGAARPLGKLTNWSPLKFLELHPCNQAAKPAHADRSEGLEALKSVVVSFVCRSLHALNKSMEIAAWRPEKFSIAYRSVQ